MDVLILERDELVAEIVVDVLENDGLTAAIMRTDHAAKTAYFPEAPRVVVTSINRCGEDLKGMETARELRSRWRSLAIIYLAALWPARLHRQALSTRERFLPKPVSIDRLTDAVRDLLRTDIGSNWRKGRFSRRSIYFPTLKLVRH